MNILELNRIYTNNPKIPIIPNKIKILFDKISIILLENFEPSHFPKKIAIESLATMPQIEPKISGILKLGCSIPRPMDVRNVLSPNSPTAIAQAISKVQFLVKVLKNLII